MDNPLADRSLIPGNNYGSMYEYIMHWKQYGRGSESYPIGFQHPRDYGLEYFTIQDYLIEAIEEDGVWYLTAGRMKVDLVQFKSWMAYYGIRRDRSKEVIETTLTRSVSSFCKRKREKMEEERKRKESDKKK